MALMLGPRIDNDYDRPLTFKEKIQNKISEIQRKFVEWRDSVPCHNTDCKNKIKTINGTRVNGIYCGKCFDYLKNESKI